MAAHPDNDEPHRGPDGHEEASDSVLFSTAFAGLGVNGDLLVPWAARAVEVGARRLSPDHGIVLLKALWEYDKHMSYLDPVAIGSLVTFFEFATVGAHRDLIRQDEYGNFMVVLLSGTVAVDRVQPWGEPLRLAESRSGEILGEMSLLDSGIRFSTCTTLGPCEIGILTADSMDDMMSANPKLAANLIALLARKLSLRLRMVSARLSDANPVPPKPAAAAAQGQAAFSKP